MVGRLFINYRSDDTKEAAAILKTELERRILNVSVYLDHAVNRGGDHYRDLIDKEIAQCDIFLCLIGPNWLDIAGEDGRPRLHVSQDIVRAEIEMALLRSKAILPVLVEGAKMPVSTSLPPTIWLLPEQTHADYFRKDKKEADLSAIVASVKRLMSGKRQFRPWRDQAWEWGFIPLTVLAFLAVGFGVGNFYPGGPIMDATAALGWRPTLRVENENLQQSIKTVSAERDDLRRQRDAANAKFDQARKSEEGMRDAFVRDVRTYSAEATLNVIQEYQRKLDEARTGTAEAEGKLKRVLTEQDTRAKSANASARGTGAKTEGAVQGGGPVIPANDAIEKPAADAAPIRKRCVWTGNWWPQCW